MYGSSQKALEAKEQDKEEVQAIFDALNQRLAASNDSDEQSAIQSEIECVKQRVKLVNNACAAIARCIEQHNSR